MSKQTKDWIIFVLGAAICAFCYWPSLNGAFIWDDKIGTISSIVTAPGHLGDIWFTLLDYDYWPLTKTFLWVEYRVFGETTTGYRIISLLLHIIVAALSLKLARQWKIKGASIAAVLFLLHPVAVPVAAWITQQKTLLMMIFIILSTINLDKWAVGRRSYHYYLSIVFFLLACLSKTVCVFFPFIALIIISTRSDQINWSSLIEVMKSMFARLRTWGRVAPYFAISLSLGVVTIVKQSGGNTDAYSADLATRVASFGWSFWFYIKNTLFPHKLAMIYPLWNDKIQELGLIGFLPLLGMLLLVATLLFTIRNRTSQWIILILGAYITLMFPALNLFQMAYMKFSMTADFYHYVGLPVLLFGIVGYISSSIDRKMWRHGLLAMSIVAVACCTFVSRERAHHYINEEALWASDIESYPRSPYAASRLAGILALSPTIHSLDQNEKEKIWNYGLELTQIAITEQPKLLTTSIIRARILIKLGRNEEALSLLLDAETIAKESNRSGDLVYIYQNLSIAYAALGQHEDALYCLEQTIGNPLLSLEAYKRTWAIFKVTRPPEEFLAMTYRLFKHRKVYQQYPDIRKDTIALGRQFLTNAGRPDLAEQLY